MYQNENEQFNQSTQIVYLYTFSRHGLKEINFFLLQCDFIKSLCSSLSTKDLEIIPNLILLQEP